MYYSLEALNFSSLQVERLKDLWVENLFLLFKNEMNSFFLNDNKHIALFFIKNR